MILLRKNDGADYYSIVILSYVFSSCVFQMTPLLFMKKVVMKKKMKMVK